MTGMRGDVWPKVPKALSQDSCADEALDYITWLIGWKIFSEEREGALEQRAEERAEEIQVLKLMS